MAWRPYENLINGELSNRVPGKVTGWMRFYRRGKEPLRVSFDLAGDFHEDIRGKVIRLKNPAPADRNEVGLDRSGTYMEGFASVQRGTVGDMTAGLSLGPWTEELARKLMAQNEVFWDENGVPSAEREERRAQYAELYRSHIEAGDLHHPYVTYPYFEWYADNGRVVLELDPSQVEVLDVQGVFPLKGKTPRELADDTKKRIAAMDGYLSGMVRDFSRESRENGGDGNVAGIVVG